MDPSKPNDPRVDQGQAIPRSRPANEEVLEGEIIDRGVPIGRPRTDPPPPSPPDPKQRKATRRTILWTLLGLAAFVCLSGLGAGYIYYNKAVEPDRSQPEGVIEQYVDVKFNKRDNIRAKLFECSSADLADIEATLNDVKALEGRFSTSAVVQPGSFDVTVDGDRADVDATLQIVLTEASGGQSITEQHWKFQLSKSPTWRLCKATKAN
ncbi:hypothetical protein [Dactylosporangium sp. CA-139066]|uniref:hypothetical protein n=1 Tax=Dactylosporangium sp. CA-139066 TaxID=3239930 RepID=UPI003D8E1E08